jgi:hypothetical protein
MVTPPGPHFSEPGLCYYIYDVNPASLMTTKKCCPRHRVVLRLVFLLYLLYPAIFLLQPASRIHVPLLRVFWAILSSLALVLHHVLCINS